MLSDYVESAGHWLPADNRHDVARASRDGRKAFTLFRWTGGELPEHAVVCRTCAEPSCCRPSHLELRHRSDVAVASPLGKLTSAEIHNIRERLAAGEAPEALAAELGISRGHVANIRDRRRRAGTP